MDKIKSFRPYDRQPRKNFQTAIKMLERSKRMGFEFTFWKLKRFCTGDVLMITDAQVRYNDLCECIWVVCIIWSVSVADVGVILVDDSKSRVRHSSIIVEFQKGCGFSKSILQYGNKRMSA